MKISLVLHRYAPEMGRVNLHHKKSLKRCLEAQKPHFPIYPAPAYSERLDHGVDTIRKARTQLRKKWGFPNSFQPSGARYCEIRATYPAPFESYNTVMTGLVMGYREALAARDAIKRKTRGGPLLDGRTMPAATVTIRTFGVVSDATRVTAEMESNRVENWKGLYS
jgi:hypothetical protein